MLHLNLGEDRGRNEDKENDDGDGIKEGVEQFHLHLNRFDHEL